MITCPIHIPIHTLIHTLIHSPIHSLNRTSNRTLNRTLRARHDHDKVVAVFDLPLRIGKPPFAAAGNDVARARNQGPPSCGDLRRNAPTCSTLWRDKYRARCRAHPITSQWPPLSGPTRRRRLDSLSTLKFFSTPFTDKFTTIESSCADASGLAIR